MKIVSFYFFILIFASCNFNKRIDSKFICTSNCDSVSRFISFKSLIDSADLLHGKFIETEGYYESTIEQSSLSQSKRERKKLIWIDFDSEFWNSSNDVNIENFTIDKKRMVVRGIIDTSNHGHLGQYIFALKKICFIKL